MPSVRVRTPAPYPGGHAIPRFVVRPGIGAPAGRAGDSSAGCPACRPVAACPVAAHGWGGPAPTGPSADPREQLLARLREHVLADVLAGHSLDEVDDWLEGVEGLGREERAALWLYGCVSAEG